jgi:Holliday junction resolvasome RuvABC ATP-dependent DNA helicase subunit
MALDVLIGRDKERRALDDLMRQRKNILILGEEGVGKTALLEDALANSKIKDILYSQRSTALKETLVNLLRSATDRKDLTQKNILALKKNCYQLLAARPEYVVLDHIAWVEAKFYAFLTFIKEQKFPFVIATRKSGKKHLGHLWMGLYDFAVLDVQNLDQENTDALADYYAVSFDLQLGADATFKKDLFKLSRGNPKIIKNLCRLARDRKYRSKGYIDLKLVDLDRRINLSLDGIEADS